MATEQRSPNRFRRRIGRAIALIAVLVALILVLPDSGRSAVDAQSALPTPVITSLADPQGLVGPFSFATDTVTVSGSLGPARDGFVAFYLCGPNEVTLGAGCFSEDAQPVGTFVPLDQNGQATSQPAVAGAVGSYCWRVEFLGSEFYAPAIHTNGDSQCFILVSPVLVLSTQATPSGTSPPVTAATDLATLNGNLGAATGTVRFSLCGPSASISPCNAPDGQLVADAVPIIAGLAQSPSVALTAPGFYCWRAQYSGDATYGPRTHTDTDAECVEITEVEEVVEDGSISQIFDAEADRRTDADGNAFYEVTSADGEATIRVRDLPAGVDSFRLELIPLDEAALAAQIEQLSPEDQALVESATAIAIARELLITDAASGDKLSVTVEIELAAPPGDPQFLLWLIETEDGHLEPLEFRVLENGRLLATAPFDLIFLILTMPAPGFSLRQGLNAVVYTGPQRVASDAFPGGPGRGDGIQALWRFSGFSFEAFFPAVPALAEPIYRLYDPLFVTAEGSTTVMQQATLVPVRRSVTLVIGANFISYTGSGGAIVDLIDAGVLARTSVVWIWRDSIGAWRGFFPGSPTVFNGLTSIQLGDLIFIHSSGSVGWDMR